MQMSSKSFSFLFFSTEISVTLAGCTSATRSASRCFIKRARGGRQPRGARCRRRTRVFPVGFFWSPRAADPP